MTANSPTKHPPRPSGRTLDGTNVSWDLSPWLGGEPEEPPNTHVFENSWSISF